MEEKQEKTTQRGGSKTHVVSKDKKKRARMCKAREYRRKCADEQYNVAKAHPAPKSNGDEKKYSDQHYFSQYSKGLPHDAQTGLVKDSAYCSLLKAVKSGKQSDYNAIQTTPGAKLVNPQAAISLDLVGCDAEVCQMAPAPTFESDAQGVEMIELYWMALLRDVPFTAYDAANELIARACVDLTRASGVVTTPANLFRTAAIAGLQSGPYVSQFLLKTVKIGATTIDGKMHMPRPANNYLMTWSEFVANQDGQPSTQGKPMEEVERYINTARDLAHYVERDVPYQGALQAALYLVNINAPAKKSNPYMAMDNQGPFVTLGSSDLFSLLAEVTNLALKTVWCQKWNVHRRLRPEAYAGCVDRLLNGIYEFPVNALVLDSDALRETFSQYSSYLLPQAYPSGSPLHPAYGSGHSVVAGASITILKAWFDESFIIPKPLQPNANGTQLVAYEGGPLTVLGELNKLAFNIGVGREMAGIHYHSDHMEGLKLGEQTAIYALRDRRGIYNEAFSGWEFTGFDGKRVHISTAKHLPRHHHK